MKENQQTESDMQNPTPEELARQEILGQQRTLRWRRPDGRMDWETDGATVPRMEDSSAESQDPIEMFSTSGLGSLI